MTARPVVLWRQPDILTLWGIPHDMRPGQSPADLFAAAPFPRPGWYGAAGRAAGPREGWRIISAGEAAGYGDAVPQAPDEWARLDDFAPELCRHCRARPAASPVADYCDPCGQALRPVFEEEADSLCYSCGELGGGHGLRCPDGPIAPAGAVLTLDRPDPRS